MKNELRSSGHTVGETNLHLQFTPAYRRDIFSEPLTRELTTAYIFVRQAMEELENSSFSWTVKILLEQEDAQRAQVFV